MALHMNAFTPLPLLTAPRRFRLGLTSYVYPSDLLTNVRQLAPFADDIEIVFFESKEACNFPSPAEVEELRQLAEQHQLSYTIHFPIDKALGSANQEEREEFMGVALRIIELCRPLKPFGWILHLEGIEATASPARVDAWRHDLAPLLRVLAGMVDDPTRFCVENLGYPFAWCEPLLLDNPFSVCLDLGHLLQMGYDWRRHVRLEHHLAALLAGNDAQAAGAGFPRVPQDLSRCPDSGDLWFRGYRPLPHPVARMSG
jgi:sugar phosphate isomerase/epimerase